MKLKRPFFSIIIPTYGRPKQLAACIRAFTCLDYPRDSFEVIVVDDGSKNPVGTVVATFQKQLDITLISQPNAGPATARNNGAAQAKGEILAFTDDDCQPAVDWLKALAIRFVVTPQTAIGGCTINALPENIYSTASQMLIDYLYAYYNADPNHSNFLASNNLAIPANQFHVVGGFDTTFTHAGGEDRDLCDRLVLNGYRLIYAKEVIVYHTHALKFLTFWKQHFSYGKGATHFHRARRLRGQPPFRTEGLPFYLNLIRYPFLTSSSYRAMLLPILLIVTQIANALGYFVQSARINRPLITNGPRHE